VKNAQQNFDMAFASGQLLAGNDALFLIEFEVMPELYQDEIPLYLVQAQFGEQHTVTVQNGSIQILPRRTELLSNYPNPFNPETWIPYRLSTPAQVVIRIFNLQGKVVRTIDIGYQEAGSYVGRDRAIYWDGHSNIGENVASGVYFYSLQVERSGIPNTGAGDFSATKKMVILK